MGVFFGKKKFSLMTRIMTATALLIALSLLTPTLNRTADALISWEGPVYGENSGCPECGDDYYEWEELPLVDLYAGCQNGYNHQVQLINGFSTGTYLLGTKYQMENPSEPQYFNALYGHRLPQDSGEWLTIGNDYPFKHSVDYFSAINHPDWDGPIVVYFKNGELLASQFDSNSNLWEDIPDPIFSGEYCPELSLAVSPEGILYVAFSGFDYSADENWHWIGIKKLIGVETGMGTEYYWELVDYAVGNHYRFDTQLKFNSNGVLYLAYIEYQQDEQGNSDIIIMRYHELENIWTRVGQDFSQNSHSFSFETGPTGELYIAHEFPSEIETGSIGIVKYDEFNDHWDSITPEPLPGYNASLAINSEAIYLTCLTMEGFFNVYQKMTTDMMSDWLLIGDEVTFPHQYVTPFRSIIDFEENLNVAFMNCNQGLSLMKLKKKEKECYIDGFVTDKETGDPIAGATVKVYGRVDKKKKVYKVKTDRNGYYKVVVKCGLHGACVKKKGYRRGGLAIVDLGQYRHDVKLQKKKNRKR